MRASRRIKDWGGAMKKGDIVADFELPDQDGQRRTLSSLLQYGSVVTSGCTKESCYFRDLGAAFEEAGAQRVGISTDSVAKQKEFSDVNGFDYPLLSDEDGEVARLFGVKRRFGPLPVKRRTFVIGSDSRLIAEIASEMNMNIHADEALQALRAASG
jgi:peroxiredoxin Q/BCP